MLALCLIDEVWTDSQVQTLPEELATIEKRMQTDPEEPIMNMMSQPEMKRLGDFVSGHILQRLKCPVWVLWDMAFWNNSSYSHHTQVFGPSVSLTFQISLQWLTTSVHSAIPVTFCHEGHMACILCVLQAMKADPKAACFECRRHSVLATTPPFVRLSKIENLLESLMNAMFLEFRDDFDATRFHRLEWQKRCRWCYRLGLEAGIVLTLYNRMGEQLMNSIQGLQLTYGLLTHLVTWAQCKLQDPGG